MSKFVAGHPGEERLLRYADGELPEREAARVRAHLEACWQCRTELSEFEKIVADCVRYRTVLRTCLPTPPAAWADIYEKFAEADASQAKRFSFGRFLNTLDAFTAPRRWIPAAGTILVLAAVFGWLGRTPRVQAAELLRRAAIAESRSQKQPPRIQIRARKRKLARTLPAPAAVTHDADLAALKAMFDTAHYSWENPLSARSFGSWRDQLREKQDEVVSEPDSYRIRTTTASNEIVSATLTLAKADLRPLQSTLEFRDQEQVSINEVAPEPAPAPETAIARRSSSIDPVLRTPDLQGPQTSRGATPGEELQVFAALHQLGADLGDPVEVSRSGGQIVVSGIGVEPIRRQQIEMALQTMPDVVVQFSEPTSGEPVPSEKSGEQPPPPAGLADLQARLEAQQGGRAAYDRFAAAVLDGYDAAMARLYALRRLAQRFPPEVEAQLAPAERETLRNLRHQHAEAFTARLRDVRRTLTPALEALGAPAPQVSAPPPAAGAWQPAAEDLFTLARRVELNLGALLGSASAGVSAAELPTRLAADLALLRARAEASQAGSHDR